MQSLYEDLAVYKKSLELVLYFENTVKHFDRYHKYCIGLEIRKTSQRIIFLVAKANNKKYRVQCLDQAIELLEELKILVRICSEIGAFKNYEKAKFPTECIVNLLKQCEGWRKSQNLAS